MRTLIKYCVSVAAAGFLSVSMQATAQDSSNDKNKPVDPVKKCQLECKRHKDNESYEACMLDCKKMNNEKKKVVPSSGG